MMAFLCGGIEYAPEAGRAWRSRLRAWLEENLNHPVYDSALEARRVLGEREWAKLGTLKATDLDRFRQVMHMLISRDLDVIANRADYVVCHWDEAAVQGGESSALLTAAYRKGIPVYLVTEIPIEQIGGWVVGCTAKILPSFDELKSYLTATYISEVRQRAFWGAR
jgi:hypothetical protein